MEKEPPILKTMYHKGDYTALNKKLKEVNWTKAFSDSCDDVNKQWAIFKQIYSDAEALYIPKKLVYLNGKLSKKFTVPLDKKNLRGKRKNKLWGKVRKKLASAEEKLQYNKLRNQIGRLTRKGKKLLEKKIASECKTNPKSFWKYAQHKLTRAPRALLNIWHWLKSLDKVLNETRYDERPPTWMPSNNSRKIHMKIRPLDPIR